jgi:membrane protein
MNIGSTVSLLKKTYINWSNHHAPRLGASVAFYTLLSFAPLLILTVAVVALVFDQHRAQAGLIDQARQMIGDRGADTVKSLLANAQKPSSGLMASIVAFVTLLFGASGVFTELRDALNIIWDAEPKNTSGLLGMVKERLFSFGMVLSVGFLLLVSLIISAGLAVLGKFFSQLLPLPAFVFETVNFAVSFMVVTLLFTLLFKFVPARQISWRDVRIGAVGTALLFTIGKFLLGFYLGKASVGSGYGAAGSLVAVIVWVYYSAQIFFFGAEFTRVYADTHSAAGLRDNDVKAAITQERPTHKQAPDSTAAWQNLPGASTSTSSVTDHATIKAGQIETKSPAKYERAAVRRREPSAASTRDVTCDAMSSHRVKPASRRSGPSLLLAAVTGFLFVRALIAKHREMESVNRASSPQ